MWPMKLNICLCYPKMRMSYNVKHTDQPQHWSHLSNFRLWCIRPWTWRGWRQQQILWAPWVAGWGLQWLDLLLGILQMFDLIFDGNLVNLEAWLMPWALSPVPRAIPVWILQRGRGGRCLWWVLLPWRGVLGLLQCLSRWYVSKQHPHKCSNPSFARITFVTRCSVFF